MLSHVRVDGIALVQEESDLLHIIGAQHGCLLQASDFALHVILCSAAQVRSAEMARDAAHDALLKAESRAAAVEDDARRCVQLELDLKA